ncbi:D-apionate lactonase [Shinella pollutisoli]|uniref:Uncharacterized protein n=1 Tax=Shinella pollutisoli TaxID=2250594 RepID=A0ABV7DAP4_9HYPH|nr:hypothetical protein [Shinella pollutisoli]
MEQPVHAARILSAGPLSVELEDGNLRALRWHGNEAIRAIAYLVRDANWGNHALQISGLTVEETKADFSVRYRAECTDGDARLAVDVHITGSAGGKLVFDAEAVPEGDFRTNRCGFCVLHPIVGVAGQPVTVEHTDGSLEQSHFPLAIEPAQPFFDIRAITHAIAPGMTALCRMEGDTFEMEDQRNWSDASYKTYVRPLALPWPYTLESGVPLRQTVTVLLSGEPDTIPRPARPDEAIRLSIRPAAGRVPAFGLGISPQELAETLDNIEALRAVAPQHLILAFDPLAGHDGAVLEGYARLLAAYPAEATLEYVLPCRALPADELQEAARMVRAADLRLSAIAVSPAPDLKSTPPGSAWPACPPLAEVYAAARAAFPDLPLGGGMFSYFTELNRKRPPVGMLDFITHTTSPLVHAADDRSVMETLEALPFITASVRAFAGDMPYRIGPSAIGMRGNPYGASLNANPDNRRMTMTADDPRQATDFAAAWMVGYAAATAGASLDVLSLGSLAGPFGLLDAGTRLPAFKAAQWLAALAGSEALGVESSDPARVLALGGGDTLLVANITPAARRVAVDGATLELGPYGIAQHRRGGAA